jgi:hypothetical protein
MTESTHVGIESEYDCLFHYQSAHELIGYPVNFCATELSAEFGIERTPSSAGEISEPERQYRALNDHI